MTGSGDPKENAQAERIHNTMKNELLKGAVFHSIEEVKASVRMAVDFYNNERPHMSIDLMTPVEAADCSGEIKKRWTSYRLIAIKSRVESLAIAENGSPSPQSRELPPATCRRPLESTSESDKSDESDKSERVNNDQA
jgi:hypothetical protein